MLECSLDSIMAAMEHFDLLLILIIWRDVIRSLASDPLRPLRALPVVACAAAEQSIYPHHNSWRSEPGRAMEKRKTNGPDEREREINGGSSSSPRSPSKGSSGGEIHQSYSKHFNENYQFSKTLIGKLVERTMLTSSLDQDKGQGQGDSLVKFPPPLIQEKKTTKKKSDLFQDEGKDSLSLLSIPPPMKLPNNFLEVSSTFPQLQRSSHNKGDGDGDDENEKPLLPQPHPSSPVFVGGQHLPEYSKLKSKVANAKGFVDLSNQNFGNHRIVVFTEALAASEKESEVQCLSLKGNRLTDVGICEIVRQLNSSLHKNLIFLDLSSNKVTELDRLAVSSSS
jgi:hypothetical protein